MGVAVFGTLAGPDLVGGMHGRRRVSVRAAAGAGARRLGASCRDGWRGDRAASAAQARLLASGPSWPSNTSTFAGERPAWHVIDPPARAQAITARDSERISATAERTNLSVGDEACRMGREGPPGDVAAAEWSPWGRVPGPVAYPGDRALPGGVADIGLCGRPAPQRPDPLFLQRPHALAGADPCGAPGESSSRSTPREAGHLRGAPRQLRIDIAASGPAFLAYLRTKYAALTFRQRDRQISAATHLLLANPDLFAMPALRHRPGRRPPDPRQRDRGDPDPGRLGQGVAPTLAAVHAGVEARDRRHRSRWSGQANKRKLSPPPPLPFRPASRSRCGTIIRSPNSPTAAPGCRPARPLLHAHLQGPHGRARDAHLGPAIPRQKRVGADLRLPRPLSRQRHRRRAPPVGAEVRRHDGRSRARPGLCRTLGPRRGLAERPSCSMPPNCGAGGSRTGGCRRSRSWWAASPPSGGGSVRDRLRARGADRGNGPDPVADASPLPARSRRQGRHARTGRARNSGSPSGRRTS